MQQKFIFIYNPKWGEAVLLKNLILKIFILLLIIFSADSTLFPILCDSDDSVELLEKKETDSSDIYTGIAIFAIVIAIYITLGIYVRSSTITDMTIDSPINRSISTESMNSMSSYVESLTDYYDNPNVGYPETKGNQP